jgi:hypothetical protein
MFGREGLLLLFSHNVGTAALGAKETFTKRRSQLSADTVEKVENRGAPKISQMSNVHDLRRSKASRIDANDR